MSFRLLSFVFLAVFISGCATYQSKVEKARHHLANRETEAALALLEPLAKLENDDQLVYAFDYATALQAAGKFKESNEWFAKADHLSDVKNYLSVTRFAGSLLLSEGVQQYRGEDHERLLVNMMAALNYTMLGDRESALVEVRRLYEKLEYYRIEQKKNYEQNTAAIYLSALLWEADRNWDSAYIDFERAAKRDETLKYIGEDLVRSATRAGREDMVEKWSKKYDVKPRPEWKDKNLGELVVIFQQGWGPRKAERERIATVNGFVSPGFPMLVPVSSLTRRAKVEVTPLAGSEGANVPVLYAENTQQIYSVQDTSIKTLEDAYGPLIAKRVAAMATKAVVAHQVNQKHEGLGTLLNFALNLADQADLRQWSTLPETIQVAKIYMRPGKYLINVRGLMGNSDSYSGEEMGVREIEIKPRDKTFVSWRSFR